LNRVLLSAAALITFTAVNAKAADLPFQHAAPTPILATAPLFTWTGFYAGVNAGSVWDDSKLTLSDIDSSFVLVNNSDNARFTGGAQIGYNYQFGGAVFGLEADINRLNLRHSYAEAFADDFNTGTLTAEQRVRWFSTLRGRLGFTPMERLLVYGTGGLAFGKVRTSTSYVGSGVDDGAPFSINIAGSDSTTRWGWTLGAGAEYAFTNNLSLKGEYSYVDLGSKNYAAVDPVRDEPNDNVKAESKFHVLRVGLNYRFNTH